MSINNELGMVALLVKKDYPVYSPASQRLAWLADNLETRDVQLITVLSNEDACSMIKVDSAIQCVILDWDLDESENHQGTEQVLTTVRSRSKNIPVFLLTKRTSAFHISIDALKSQMILYFY